MSKPMTRSSRPTCNEAVAPHGNLGWSFPANLMKSGRFLSLIMLAVFASACSQDPGKAKLKYFQSGQAYFEKGNFPAAAIQFRRAIQADPRYAAAHYQLARAYRESGDVQDAYKELAETVDLEPQNMDAQTDLATLLVISGQFDLAQGVLLGQEYVAKRDSSKAIPEFQKAIQLEPGNALNYVALADLYFSSGDKTAAAETYKQGVATNPKSFKAHLALAQFYFGEKLYPDAETEINSSIELAPKELLPRFYLAWLYAGMGKVPQAENAYADMKKVAPHDPLAYRALGRFYLASHQEEKALTEGLAK